MKDVLKITVYLKKMVDMGAVNEVYATFFKNYLPTLTIVAVDALPMQGALVQIDAIVSNGIGTLPQDPCNLIKVANNSDNTPTSSVST